MLWGLKSSVVHIQDTNEDSEAEGMEIGAVEGGYG